MRVNFEDEWLLDPRREALVKVLGDEYLVDGLARKIWRTGLYYWSRNKSPIPGNIFNAIRLSDKWLEVGLAEVKENGVYIKGAEKKFSWIVKLQRASKKGGRAFSDRWRALKLGAIRPPLDGAPTPTPTPPPILKEKKEEKERKNSHAADAAALLSYLNAKANTGFRADTKQHLRCITARLDRYPLDELKKVIDKKLQDEWFVGNGHMNPQTLFGSDAKVEKYLECNGKKTSCLENWKPKSKRGEIGVSRDGAGIQVGGEEVIKSLEGG